MRDAPFSVVRFLAASVSLLIACAPAARAQPAEGAASEAPSDLMPGSWEFTAQVGSVGYWQGGSAPMSMASGRAYELRAGWRPFSSRRGLVEVYVLHAPRDGDVASGRPRFNAVGIGGTFLARPAAKRINPYLVGGIGLWRVEARSPVPCSSPEGPPAPDSRCPSADHSFEDATLPAATLGAGLYLTVLPPVALRAGAKLYAPLGEGSDSGSPRPVLSAGVSVRLGQ